MYWVDKRIFLILLKQVAGDAMETYQHHSTLLHHYQVSANTDATQSIRFAIQRACHTERIDKGESFRNFLFPTQMI